MTGNVRVSDLVLGTRNMIEAADVQAAPCGEGRESSQRRERIMTTLLRRGEVEPLLDRLGRHPLELIVA